MKKKKVSEKENEWKGVLQEKSSTITNFYQTGESTVTPDSFTVTNTNVVNEKKNWGFTKENLNKWDEEEYCNVGVNKDWNFTKEELNKFYHDSLVKENRIHKQKKLILNLHLYLSGNYFLLLP